MTRIHVFCEGQTEDTFVREVLLPHFDRLGVWLNPIVMRTSPAGKGGAVSYPKIKRQIERKCKEDQAAYVTTFLDYYHLPTDFPAMNASGDSFCKCGAIELGFAEDIAQSNFIPNIVVHEFEGLLFSDPGKFDIWFEDRCVLEQLTHIRGQFETPEHINDSPMTAPSKRILKVCAGYDKPLHGSLIAIDIGLDTIRRECPKFNAWIEKLEALAE